MNIRLEWGAVFNAQTYFEESCLTLERSLVVPPIIGGTMVLKGRALPPWRSWRSTPPGSSRSTRGLL